MDLFKSLYVYLYILLLAQKPGHQFKNGWNPLWAVTIQSSIAIQTKWLSSSELLFIPVRFAFMTCAKSCMFIACYCLMIDCWMFRNNRKQQLANLHVQLASICSSTAAASNVECQFHVGACLVVCCKSCWRKVRPPRSPPEWAAHGQQFIDDTSVNLEHKKIGTHERLNTRK